MQCELKKLRGNTNETNFTIFRTPPNISFKKEKLFYPSVISIGPIHRKGGEHLRALEVQKWRFLQNFLSRENHVSLDLCISKMKKLEEKTRCCYSETFDKLKRNAFVQMMLLDGCFIIEFFLKVYKEKNLHYSRVIYRDLLLLENQIPFFIVEKLYKIGNLNQVLPITHFVKYITYYSCAAILSKEYVSIDSPAEILAKIPEPPAEIHHLVHLWYHYLVPSPKEPHVVSSKPFDLTRMFSRGRSPHSTSRSSSLSLLNFTKHISPMGIPCATELTQKGLLFERKSNPENMLDVSFELGVLKIPRLVITNATKPIFANLIAFENSNYRKENSPFTSFVSFLDNLVNTPNDVTILQQCGIIENRLGNEEELALFINQVTEGGSIGKKHYLAKLFEEVNKYIEINWDKSRWNRHRANLIRDYFSSPWTAISLLAAFILLVLTCIQTFYAVYAYKFPPSS